MDHDRDQITIDEKKFSSLRNGETSKLGAIEEAASGIEVVYHYCRVFAMRGTTAERTEGDLG